MFDDEFDPEDFEREKERIRNLPIHIKAREIFELVQSIVATIEEVKGDDSSMALNTMKELLIEDSLMLQVKLSGAEAAGLYELKMANAAIIRQSALNLTTHTSGMLLFGYKFQEYTDLLRDEMEEFRLLFLDWISGFDTTDRGIDRWGMFNPPGVDPNEEEDLF